MVAINAEIVNLTERGIFTVPVPDISPCLLDLNCNAQRRKNIRNNTSP